MATRKILQETDSQLKKISKPVKQFDEKLWDLLDDMKETMEKAQGAGLAAVQVGILRRVFIIEINNMYLELINPEIINQEGEQTLEEACLSIQNITGLVKRPKLITVKAYDRYANEYTITGTDYLAVALSHEYDHLEGILFTDKATKIIKGEKL
jgi:peptide deformylase